MAESRFSKAVRQLLHSLAPAGADSGGEDDFSLLERFAHAGNESAFATLVGRHGPMVWRTCQRIVRQSADAEDAFQATFLVLCRKAGSIRRRESLGGWLHQVAYRIALRLRNRPVTLSLDIAQFLTAHSDPAAEAAQADLRPMLDESLQRLPEKYRVPLVLCCLQGKTLRRAAAELGWAHGTLATRLARGKELLRANLKQHDVTLSVTALATLLTQESVAGAAPRALIQATLKLQALCLLGEATGAGGLATRVVHLAEGALQAMLLTRITKAAVIVAALGVFGAGSGAILSGALAGRAEVEAPEPAAAQGELSQPLDARQARVDSHGDSLPAGALARMGTVRLRHVHFSPFDTALSPDSKLLVSGGYLEIRHWDRATGKLLREIRDGKRTMYCIFAFAPDGRWLAGAGMHSTSIWDLATGKHLFEFPANGQGLAVSPDGKQLAASFQDASVGVWDTTTGREIARFGGDNKQGPMRLTLRYDGKHLITSAGTRIIRWDPAEGKLQSAVNVPAPYTWMSLAPNGQTALLHPAADKAEPLALWDFGLGKEPRKLQGKLAFKCGNLAFSPDGKTLVMNTAMRYEDPGEITIGFWDVKSGEFLRQLRLPTRYVRSLGFSPDGRMLLTTHEDPVIRFWDVATGKEVLPSDAHTDYVQSLAFTPDGRSLVSGSLDRTVRLWEVATGRQLRELASHRGRCEVVAVAPDGKILSGGADGCVRVLDQDGKSLQRILLDGAPETQVQRSTHVQALGVTPDGKTLATYACNYSRGPALYHRWDLATGKMLAEWPDTSQFRGNRRVFSADAKLTLESFQEPGAATTQFAPVPAGAAPPRNFESRVNNGGVIVRDAATGREMVRLRHPGFANCGALSPDGRTAVAAVSREEKVTDAQYYENTLHFWELGTRKERFALSSGITTDWIRHVAYAPDGRMLATAHNEGVIRFWDLIARKEVAQRIDSSVHGLDNSAASLAFSPDSRLLAAGYRDGTILVWSVPVPSRPREYQPVPETLQPWLLAPSQARILRHSA